MKSNYGKRDQMTSPLWVIDGGKWETNFHFLLLAFFIFWVSFYPQWILYAFQNACLSSCSSLILASIPFGIDEKRANIVVLPVSSSSQPGLLYEYSTYIRWYTFYIFLDKFKHRRRLYFFSHRTSLGYNQLFLQIMFYEKPSQNLPETLNFA